MDQHSPSIDADRYHYQLSMSLMRVFIHLFCAFSRQSPFNRVIEPQQEVRCLATGQHASCVDSSQTHAAPCIQRGCSVPGKASGLGR